MAEKVYAKEKLAELMGASPEFAPTRMIRRDAELLGGATVGHRISKYGVKYGLEPLFKALGEAIEQPVITDYAKPIGEGVAGTVSVIGLLVFTGKWTRIISWGALFKTVEEGLDYLESLVVPE